MTLVFFFLLKKERERERKVLHVHFFFFCHKEPAQIFSSHKLFWVTRGSFSIKSKFNEQRSSLASSSPKSETKLKAAFQRWLTETQDPAAREHKLNLRHTFLSLNVWVRNLFCFIISSEDMRWKSRIPSMLEYLLTLVDNLRLKCFLNTLGY